MILSPRAGGVGLTLTSANHVIHLSRWWNPAVEDQCTDRVYRIGAKRDVHVYYPLAVHPLYSEGSFDELLHALLERKRLLSHRMLVPPVDPEADRQWFANHLGRPEAPSQSDDVAEVDLMEPNSFEQWALRRCVAFGGKHTKHPALTTVERMVFCRIGLRVPALLYNASTSKMSKAPAGQKQSRTSCERDHTMLVLRAFSRLLTPSDFRSPPKNARRSTE